MRGLVLATVLVAITVPVQAAPADWRTLARPADRTRLRDWRTAFRSALDDAGRRGDTRALARLGVLIDPDAGRPRPTPPPSDYRCRVIKLGSPHEAGLPFVAYSGFRCRIDRVGSGLRFRKLTGSQRPIGMLYPDTRRGTVFLGTLTLGDEIGAPVYGRDADRDMIGVVEAIGTNRWRLLLPYPRFESLMDVIELVPTR